MYLCMLVSVKNLPVVIIDNLDTLVRVMHVYLICLDSGGTDYEIPLAVSHENFDGVARRRRITSI